jgi:predicted transcriptional regulator
MPSLTVKLPSALDKKLRTLARKRGEKISVTTRRALEKELAGGEPDFAKLAENFRGMMKGPRDLSTREGYGS